MAFRHVVMMRWTPEATEAQKAAVRAGLEELPGRIPEIRSYSLGTDARVTDGNFDFVVVADFDDVAGYLVYRDHPDHQAVIAEHIRPILADRAAVQHDLSTGAPS
jgi:Stress responsive A/B Barrel Domain